MRAENGADTFCALPPPPRSAGIHVSSSYYICVLILLQMCPHTTICVLILLHMCPHGTVCVLILLYVSSYYYICVLLLYICVSPPPPRSSGIHVSSSSCISVRILLHMRPHTTRVCLTASSTLLRHTCVSSFSCISVLILLHVSSYHTRVSHRLLHAPQARRLQVGQAVVVAVRAPHAKVLRFRV
jgi:hypothetical protein